MPGLLWYDNDPRTPLAAKATDAAERYLAKFGVAPDVCYVSARSLQAAESVPFRDGALRLTPASNILVNHFWVEVMA